MYHVHLCSELAAYLIQGYKNGGTCILAVYFHNWHMFHEYMNSITC